MKRSMIIVLAQVAATICLSRSAIAADVSIQSLLETDNRAAYGRFDDGAATASQLHVWFQDRTREIVGDALELIDRNQREGAALDQRWYGFRRFRPTLEQVLRAREVRFYGGREGDVLSALASQYISIIPYEGDQDPGEMRVFTGFRDGGGSDLIIIGQNGREVALKTMIRLTYLFKFSDERTTQRSAAELDRFLERVKIFFSSVPPRQEFISFFQRYRIADPDVVLIGFQRDTRLYLKEIGIGDPERYSTDSLRINWYPSANGKKLLLVSINGNRIFASRAGELVKAMLQSFRSPPHAVVFFGSAGAVDSADLLGRVIAPTVVVSDDYFDSGRRGGKVAYLIRNRAEKIVPTKTAHTSVESMVVETRRWAAANKNHRITTVDQELYHLVEAISASPCGRNIQLFVGMLVTDNVPSVKTRDDATLQHAEQIIAHTASVRRRFLEKVFSEIGITAQSVARQSNHAVNE